MDLHIQALKQFTSGNKGSSASGGSQTQLISMAMAEATKLFDKSGGATSGNKQDAVNGAAMTVMKLMVQSKFSGAVGGGNSGGLGGLMSLVGGLLLYSSCSPSMIWVSGKTIRIMLDTQFKCGLFNLTCEFQM